ncbi:low temperature requirement protein A [Phytohabitans sp. ZYX-F-186]|uniref:Low temperature requirement protein A n=1 Tax=Phytohabitans maris TaxID=3071409 RepID=A0ABU0ZIT4_9ACTN|nr:low temperature requirement protein A [Phytohabitans sp. ZYX-F-186]MDQ7906287.1 low temperature requirement protein A [Phytohabitans sp. ZYX-F-186]
MARTRWRHSGDPAGRVTTVELFFDVVFVFTLTQLTRVLEEHLTLTTVGQVLLLFGIMWWMFDGYVWLANHVPPRHSSQKLLLFVGMAGFLTAAVGVPRAFDGTGVVVGVGYLVVICVHLLLFTQAGLGRALTLLAVYNIGAALLVLGGGFADGGLRTGLWVGALALQMIVPYLVPRHSWMGTVRSFHLAPEHFVERHGLLVIIALGESVVAIGAGVDTEHITAGTVAVVVLALALPAGLWWTYFTDTHAAEVTLARTTGAAASRLALWLGLTHIPLLLGIVVAAAGIHGAVAHPGDHAHWPEALALAGGVAAYLCGIAAIRHALGVRPVWRRLLTAAAVLATVPVGTEVGAGLQLAAVAAVVAVPLVVERGRHSAPASSTMERAEA